jgi:hypothetical protein
MKKKRLGPLSSDLDMRDWGSLHVTFPPSAAIRIRAKRDPVLNLETAPLPLASNHVAHLARRKLKDTSLESLRGGVCLTVLKSHQNPACTAQPPGLPVACRPSPCPVIEPTNSISIPISRCTGINSNLSKQIPVFAPAGAVHSLDRRSVYASKVQANVLKHTWNCWWMKRPTKLVVPSRPLLLHPPIHPSIQSIEPYQR